MLKQLVYISFLYFLLQQICVGQNEPQLSNLRAKVLATNADTLIIDSLSIVPNSLAVVEKMTRKELDTTLYKIDFAKAQLIWAKKIRVDSVKVAYRVFPFNFTAKRYHKDIQEIQKFGEQPIAYRYKLDNKSASSLFNAKGLDYSGSFGRGISFGNNQDLVLNSNFNLQLAGKLSNDIEVLAAITDSNIPFQPEGNTQQLQEFDRIYIQLKKAQHTLLVGDYDLKRPNSYFMNVARRLQGGQFSTAFDLGNKRKISTAFSGAIAKGNFNRMTFTGQEGNQGPYKLLGANNEIFIIVLSGSERVYIDGQLMTRGAENDYVIDYNLGEVVFTDNQLITKDKRIVIEFEYADQNYLRSLFYINGTYQSEKLEIRANYFTEQDAKNQPLIDGELSEKEIQVLENAGDDLQKAVVQSVDSIGFNPDRVLYKMVDSLIGNVLYDSVFIYSTHADSAIFNLNFSFVGANRGAYKLSTRSVNGRIYEWSAPDSLGQPTGDYQPIIQLITPKKRQLATIALTYKPNKKTQISTELAHSNRDENTFSKVDDEDDTGIAATIKLENNHFLKEKKAGIRLQTTAQYEFVQANFQALEPYRTVEFARDWNLNNTQKETEHIAKFGVQLSQKTNKSLSYQLSTLLRGKQIYQGFQHALAGRYKQKNWDIAIQTSFLTAQDSTTTTQFLRPKINITKSFPKLKNWQIGTIGETEQNKINNQLSDEKLLTNNSFYFNQFTIFLKTPDTSRNKFAINYIKRWDYQLKTTKNGFETATIGTTANITGALTKNPKNRLEWNVTYRDLDSLSTKRPKDNRTLLGQIKYNVALKKGLARLNFQYQLGSGQHQPTEYFYQKVNDGQGNYVWNDDGDEVEELQEFELAGENDIGIRNNYVRIVLPTNQFVATTINQFNLNTQINPKAIWFNKKGWKKTVSRFSLQSAFLIRQEQLVDTSSFELSNLLGLGNVDTSLIVDNTSIRNTLFFNRNSPKFEASIFQINTVNQAFLLNGTDRRGKTESGLNFKFGLSSKFSATTKAVLNQLTNDSKAFPTRNYDIKGYSIIPSLNFVYKQRLRLTSTYTFKKSQDQLANPSQPATINRFSVDGRYGSAAQSSISGKVSIVNIQFEGKTNNSTNYNLLEGLQPGQNYLWNLTYDTRLQGNILLSFNYEGRKNGDNRPNHVGRASLRAIF